MKVEILEVAERELDDGFIYYESLQDGLGKRFLFEIKNSIGRIVQYPNGWHPLSNNTRRSLVKKFPYGIVYQILEDKISIVAIAHLHRKPNYWKDRIK